MQVTKEMIKALASQIFMNREMIEKSDWFLMEEFFIAKDIESGFSSFALFKDSTKLGNIHSLGSVEHIHATITTMFNDYIRAEVEDATEYFLRSYGTKPFIHKFHDLTLARGQAGRSGLYANDTLTKGDQIVYRKCMLTKDLDKDILEIVVRDQIHTLVLDGVITIEI